MIRLIRTGLYADQQLRQIANQCRHLLASVFGELVITEMPTTPARIASATGATGYIGDVTFLLCLSVKLLVEIYDTST